MRDGREQGLRELYAAARTVRGAMPVDHPARKAGETLAELLADMHADGFSYSALDRAMGASIGTARNRLARHGYLEPPPSLEAVQYRGVRSQPPRGPRLDITAQRFGNLTAVRPTGESRRTGAMWLFRCDCGNERVAAAPQVRTGRITLCSRSCAARKSRRPTRR